MDNNARSKAGQSAFDAIPKTQAVSGQYDASQQSQQTANSDPFEDYFKGQSTTSQKQPFAPSQQAPQQKQQQIPVSNLEQKPSTAIGMDEDDKDDRTQIIDQKNADAETPSPVIQPSHPEVLIKKELSEIVKPGPDAEIKKLPEEPERLGDIAEEDKTQQTGVKKAEDTLPMTYGEAMLAKRKERSIKKGISWIVRLIVKQWKKRFIKTKEQRSKEQVTSNK